MRDRRVLIGAAGRWGNVLKIRPPLCFSTAHADQLVSCLDDALRVTVQSP
jgi:4-aminobutyrate aminotransferase-like enzyme